MEDLKSKNDIMYKLKETFKATAIPYGMAASAGMMLAYFKFPHVENYAIAAFVPLAIVIERYSRGLSNNEGGRRPPQP